MLTAEPHVPYTVTQVIAGADGGQVVGAMTTGADRANLCVQDRTKASAACAALDLAGWTALRDLADEMVGRLAADAGAPAGVAGATPDSVPSSAYKSTT